MFEGYDTVVSPSASCTAFLREKGVERVFDAISLRLLHVGDRPLRLLRAVQGIDLVEIEDAQECCGFGGRSRSRTRTRRWRCCWRRSWRLRNDLRRLPLRRAWAQKLSKLGRGPLGKLPVPGWSAMRDLPEVPEKTFREWWRDR